MPIPKLPQFESLLESLTMKEPNNKEGYKSIIVLPGMDLQDEDKLLKEVEYRMWYKDTPQLSLEAFIRRVNEEHSRNIHTLDKNVSLVVLGIYSLIHKPQNKAVDIFNKLFQHVVVGDLIQYFVLPSPPVDDYEVRIGSFQIGLLNKDKFQYRCLKVESDFYEKYENALVEKLTIERDLLQVYLFDWENALSEFNIYDSNVLKLLINNYFFYVSASLFNDFWDQLVEQQELIVALTDTYIDGADLRLLPNVIAVSIYMNFGRKKWGLVAPNVSYPMIELAKTDKKIPAAIELIKSYDIDVRAIPNSELQMTLHTYAKFIQRAKLHQFAYRTDEAFLHYIIALDLLLGEKNNNTSTVSSRVAVLTFRAFSQAYYIQRKKVEELYDKRSLYVHKGRNITDEDLEVADSISKEILLCLLRMNKMGRGKQPDFILSWLKDLDFIISAILAERDISDEEYINNGILISTDGTNYG